MRIELLYFSGCPNAEPVREKLAELLKRRGRKDRIERVRITDEQDAVHQRFLGSPTVRIDGEDIEPGASDRANYGLNCRMYRSGHQGLRKVPDDVLISNAIDAAVGQEPPANASGTSPLRYWRMVFIGGLAILLGAFLGLIVVWGQPIAITGAVLVATSYANNGNEHARQPFMWWAGTAGFIWAGATIAYWWLFRSSLELPPADRPSATVYDLLFYIGLLAFGLMLAATLTGTVLRARSKHRPRHEP